VKTALQKIKAVAAHDAVEPNLVQIRHSLLKSPLVKTGFFYDLLTESAKERTRLAITTLFVYQLTGFHTYALSTYPRFPLPFQGFTSCQIDFLLTYIHLGIIIMK